jgi:hypothetical protein
VLNRGKHAGTVGGRDGDNHFLGGGGGEHGGYWMG